MTGSGMRVAAFVVALTLVSIEAGAQAPYYPDVYLASQFEAPPNAPSRVVVAGPDEPGERLARRQAGRPEIPLNFPKNTVAIRPVMRGAEGVWRATRDIEMVRE